METKYEANLRQKMDLALRELQDKQKAEFENRFESLYDIVKRDGIIVGEKYHMPGAFGDNLRVLDAGDGIAAIAYACSCDVGQDMLSLMKVGGVLDAYKAKYYRYTEGGSRAIQVGLDGGVGDKFFDMTYQDCTLNRRLPLSGLKRIIDAATILHKSQELIALNESGSALYACSSDPCHQDFDLLGRMIEVFGFEDVAYVAGLSKKSSQTESKTARSVRAALEHLRKE